MAINCLLTRVSPRQAALCKIWLLIRYINWWVRFFFMRSVLNGFQLSCKATPEARRRALQWSALPGRRVVGVVLMWAHGISSLLCWASPADKTEWLSSASVSLLSSYCHTSAASLWWWVCTDSPILIWVYPRQEQIKQWVYHGSNMRWQEWKHSPALLRSISYNEVEIRKMKVKRGRGKIFWDVWLCALAFQQSTSFSSSPRFSNLEFKVPLVLPLLKEIPNTNI